MGQDLWRAVDPPLLRDLAVAEQAFAENGEQRFSALCWAASIVAALRHDPGQDAAEDRLSQMIGAAGLTPDRLAWVRRLRADGQHSPGWTMGMTAVGGEDA